MKKTSKGFFEFGSCDIPAFRKMHNMTQADLAERLNDSDKAVSKWERGESMPDVLTLVQLSERFGVSMDALVGCSGAVTAGKSHAQGVTSSAVRVCL